MTLKKNIRNHCNRIKIANASGKDVGVKWQLGSEVCVFRVSSILVWLCTLEI